MRTANKTANLDQTQTSTGRNFMIPANQTNEDTLEELKKLEKKVVQITEKNIGLFRQNEQQSYENTKDAEIIRLTKSIISGQRDKRRRNLEENQEQIDQSEQIQNDLAQIQEENRKLDDRIKELLDAPFLEELPPTATKEQRMDFMRRKIRALQIKNKIQRSLIKEAIPSSVKRLQLIKKANQERVDYADERRKAANEILAQNEEKLIPQQIAKIEAIHDIADDAELCSSRTNIDSLEFETSFVLGKARVVEDENQKRNEALTKRQNHLQKLIRRKEKKQQEAELRAQQLAREEEEKAEQEQTEVHNDEHSSEEEEEPQNVKVSDQYTNISPEERSRRKKIKEDFLKKCRQVTQDTNNAIQREVLEMQLAYAKIQRSHVDYKVQFNEKELARNKHIQEESQKLLDKYHEEASKLDESIEEPRNNILEQIKRNNLVLAEARDELAIIQNQIKDMEDQLQQAKDSAQEAVAQSQKA